MKNIVVIGGGFAGSKVCKSLENYFNVTLIDNKDYFEFTPSILRTIIRTEHSSKIQILHKKYLKKTNFIKGNVKKIGKDYVLVNKKINFDYLIICSGSRYNSPFKESNLILPTRSSKLIKYHKELENAKKVLIIGGGLVGVELTGEIIDFYKEKEVVLIHNKHRLIERNPDKASKYANDFLKRKNVKIIYDDRIIKKDKNNYITEKGEKIKCDIAFLCTGITPNSDFIDKKLLDKNKLVKVNEHMQVIGYSNIFSVGDVNNVFIEKTAQNAENQAEIAIRNIINLEKGKDLVEYNGKNTPLVISLGRNNGIFVFRKIVIHGFLIGILKDAIEWIEMRKLK